MDPAIQLANFYRIEGMFISFVFHWRPTSISDPVFTAHLVVRLRIEINCVYSRVAAPSNSTKRPLQLRQQSNSIQPIVQRVDAMEPVTQMAPFSRTGNTKDLHFA